MVEVSPSEGDDAVRNGRRALYSVTGRGIVILHWRAALGASMREWGSNVIAPSYTATDGDSGQNAQRGATRLDHTADQGIPREQHADFGDAYVVYGTAIFNYVRRLVANEADAEDLTLAAFEKALRAWSRRPPDDELRPWLFRIATNVCLDELRRRQRIRWHPWSAIADVFRRVPAALDDPEDEVIRRERVALVRAALNRLAPRDRAALLMREQYGLSVDDVGQALGISRSATKIALFRARERLRAAYLQLGGEAPFGRANPNERRTTADPLTGIESGRSNAGEGDEGDEDD